MAENGRKLSFGLLLDTIERVILAGLFVYFAYNMLTDYLEGGHLLSLILLISETAVLVFILIRRPTANISQRPTDWGLAFLATLMPMLAYPGGEGRLLPDVILVTLLIAGVAIQISAKMSLRRSFGIVAANRGVKMNGPYRFVRHPMYAGYFLTQFGYLLGNPTLRNLAAYSLAWGLQLARILAEERLLLNDETYRGFAARVPYRLIPRVF
jgi:protein-S-isoprenylcysteine O-methyltransferase Ste14